MYRIFLCLMLVAIHSYAAQFVSLKIKDRLFTKIELATTAEQQTKGLMNRTSLPQDGGMLFVFSESRILAFWMKNTRIPLDIIFMDSQGTVTAVHTMKVESPQGRFEPNFIYCNRLPSYSSNSPAQYALEINAGLIHALHIAPGDKIILPQL